MTFFEMAWNIGEGMSWRLMPRYWVKSLEVFRFQNLAICHDEEE
jgi:hypothetical protein